MTDCSTSQTWDPDRYRRNAGFVADYGESMIRTLEAGPGDTVLDLGCGDGRLTRKIADTGATVLGVDTSAEQVAAARAMGLDAEVADAAALRFDNAFDAVFSNAALHWVKDADTAIDGVWRALKPGGRFVGELGGAGNVATVTDAMAAALAARGIDIAALWPWFFPDADDYRARLERRGFRIVSIEHFDRPTPIPGRLGDWLETFGESFLAAVPEAERPALKDAVEARTRGILHADGEGWHVDYVRLRFHAVKPTEAGS